MKAISLHQPWASAIAHRIKHIETRSFEPVSLIGQRIAIHAATKWTREQIAVLEEINQNSPIMIPSPLPLGAIVATAIIDKCQRVEDIFAEPAWCLFSMEAFLGDYSCGRFGWHLRDVVKLTHPFLCRGRQGWFNVDIPGICYEPSI